MQPIHCTADMQVADRWLGRAGRARQLRLAQPAGAHGARLAFGSDCPVETFDPLLGIHAAVTRQDVTGHPPGGWYPAERLTVDEAVYAYTQGAAFAAGEEAIKGSLTPGKLADLVVLSQDIFTADSADLPHHPGRRHHPRRHRRLEQRAVRKCEVRSAGKCGE